MSRGTPESPGKNEMSLDRDDEQRLRSYLLGELAQEEMHLALVPSLYLLRWSCNAHWCAAGREHQAAIQFQASQWYTCVVALDNDKLYPVPLEVHPQLVEREAGGQAYREQFHIALLVKHLVAIIGKALANG